MPKVSFLMSVYNGAQFLRQTMDSLIAQDFDDYEIFIIDDGSTDQSAEIIESYNSPLVKYHKQDNAGLVAALNTGLGMLDCDYVARIDADDICRPNRLSRQMDFMEFTRADVTACRALHIDEFGHPEAVSFVHFVYDPDPRWVPPKEPYLAHPFMFGRLDVMAGHGYRDAHLSEDADLCWRLSETNRIALQNEVLGDYRMHLASVSAADITGSRIQAFFAALAAVNAQRRADGRAEVPYDQPLATCKAVGATTQGLVDLFKSHLSKDERIWITLAATMKLLQNAYWRGYKLGQQDFDVAEKLLRKSKSISAENRTEALQTITTLKMVPDRQWAN